MGTYDSQDNIPGQSIRSAQKDFDILHTRQKISKYADSRKTRFSRFKQDQRPEKRRRSQKKNARLNEAGDVLASKSVTTQQEAERPESGLKIKILIDQYPYYHVHLASFYSLSLH